MGTIGQIWGESLSPSLNTIMYKTQSGNGEKFRFFNDVSRIWQLGQLIKYVTTIRCVKVKRVGRVFELGFTDQSRSH